MAQTSDKTFDVAEFSTGLEHNDLSSKSRLITYNHRDKTILLSF
jgi:hypothetical protein